MSEFTTVIVEKPKWFRIAPMKTGFGTRPPYVIGFDTEAYKGAPMLMQFSPPGVGMTSTDLVWTNKHDSLLDFIEYLEPVAREHARSRQVLVFGFNLRYEYTQLFRNLDPEVWEQSHFTLHWHEQGECEGKPDDDWSVLIEAMNDKRYTFTVSYAGSMDSRRGKRRDRYPIKVIDAMAFFNTSLDKAAKVIGIEGKTDYPEELKGNLPPRRAMKDERFLEYSRRDAYITRLLGEKIVDYHKAFDVKITLSAPMYAAYVFRRRFLQAEIPLCEEPLEDAGLKSYHGGKNGYYLDRPRVFAHAYDYDVNAAYTSAMASLPDPVSSVWEETTHYEAGVHALWYVRAHVQSCVFRAFQEVTGRWFTWKDDGDLAFWITSYELDQAIALGEVRDMYECGGFIMRGESGTGPIREFCDEMYRLKRYGVTPEERQMAKLCLNSLYGKLIQKVPNHANSVFPMFDVLEDEYGNRSISDVNMVAGGYRAGGLYHPALASLVTGNVRARIHALEHKYDSLMTSTDGFLSLVEPDPSDIGDEFGMLKVKEGSLSIWRERLYLFEPEGGDPIFALHGFRGRLADLRTIPVAPGEYSYRATQMVGLRESTHKLDGTRYEPGQFASLPFTLDLTSVNARSPLRVSNT